MAFLDLPDDILLEILVSHLRPHPPLTPGCPYNLPFFLWQGIVEATNEDSFKLAGVLRSTALVCRRLHNIAIKALYRYIPLSTKDDSSKIFISTLSKHPHLSVYIRSVDINCEHFEVAMGIKDLFWLPNIHTICIRKCPWVDWHRRAFKNLDHVRTSPVQVLRFTECKLDNGPLSQILSWPKALKQLWYHAVIEPYEDRRRRELDCGDVQRALATQADCLEEVVLTVVAYTYRIVGGVLDFRNYSKLKSLRIQGRFLLNSKANDKLWERLPKSLQELEIGYLDRDTITDNLQDFECSRVDWLMGMFGKMVAPENEDNPKGVFTPSLERVRLVVPLVERILEPELEENQTEADFNFDFDEHGGITDPVVNWRPPSKLMGSSKRAGVSLSIYALTGGRYRYTIEGDKGFENVWEDTWDRFNGMYRPPTRVP
ncbi:hypothetical protein M434DRAFT_36877 [Hypoxylon sp. CO27-5]|nr:hypothetical protein M434DRAFT_36877 [Hypoxylon sp. CO27-5]